MEVAKSISKLLMSYANLFPSPVGGYEVHADIKPTRISRANDALRSNGLYPWDGFCFSKRQAKPESPCQSSWRQIK